MAKCGVSGCRAQGKLYRAVDNQGREVDRRPYCARHAKQVNSGLQRMGGYTHGCRRPGLLEVKQP